MDRRFARTAYRIRHCGRHLGLIVAALILAALGAVIYWRIPLAETALRRLAADAGFDHVTFAITRLDLAGAEIDDLRVGTALRIGQTDLDWNWREPLSRPVARLAAKRVQFDIGGLRKLIARHAGGGATGTLPETLAALIDHMPAITFDPTEVILPLPGAAGGAAVTIQGAVVPDPSGVLTAYGRLRLALSRAQIATIKADDVNVEGAYSLRLTGNALALTLPQPLELRARTVAVGSAKLAPVALTLTGASSPAARLTLDADNPIGSIAAAFSIKTAPVAIRIGGDSTPATLPLTLGGTLRLAGRMARFAGQATGAGGMPVVAITAQQALSAMSGKAELSLKPLRLGASDIQPGMILPALARLKAMGGTINGAAAVDWGGPVMHAAANIGFDGVSLADTETGATVDGLSGTVAFDSLSPPTTPADQVLRARRLDAGIALDDAMLRFRLLNDRAGQPVIALREFNAGFAGGRIAVDDGRVEASGDVSLPLRITGVALGTFLGEVGAEGVGGTGTVDGTIPLRIEQGRVAVAHGSLAARGPGRLSIRSRTVRDALVSAGKEVALMLSALDDFHYDRLSATIEKPADGVAHLRLETFGRNPAVEGGRPFAINLNLETDIDRIAASLAQALRLPGSIVGAIVRHNR